MKTQLILLAEPILVSDEEINEGDNVLDNVYRIWTNIESCWLKPMKDAIKNQSIHYMPKGKIIAGIPELPLIDFSALSKEDCKKIGWVDVEKLANDYAIATKSPNRTAHKFGFIEGFKTAQSLNEKKFSEEGILKAIAEAQYFSDIIHILRKPKIIDVEVEMEDLNDYDDDETDGLLPILRPKITNNSIKIIKIL